MRERRKINLLVDRYSLAKVIAERKANKTSIPRTTAEEEAPKEESKTQDGKDPDFIEDEATPFTSR